MARVDLLVEKKTMWCVYLVRCSDDSLYCGSTTDVRRRLEQHNKGVGARYTCGRRPVKLVWTRVLGSRSDAQRLEAIIKKMPKADKERMVRERLPWPYEAMPTTLNAVAADELRQQVQVKLEREFEGVDLDTPVPGIWCCRGCSFKLHKKVLSVSRGELYVDARLVREDCPNGHGLLVQATERDLLWPCPVCTSMNLSRNNKCTTCGLDLDTYDVREPVLTKELIKKTVDTMPLSRPLRHLRGSESDE